MLMIELLTQFGLPAAALVALAVVAWAAQQLFGLVAAQKSKLAQDVYAKALEEIDSQLEEFYLPVRERLAVTQELSLSTTLWLGKDGKYDNAQAGINSDNPRSLRNIAVRNVFMPLNKEIEQILLEKQHLRHPDDDTDYRSILRHLILWTALEKAAIDGEIEKYELEGMLKFPAEETERQHRMSQRLIDERTQLREQILRFGRTSSSIVGRLSNGKNPFRSR
jgi:hypothetical protein